MDIIRPYSVKKHYTHNNRRKQVIQNSPISFRPTNQVKTFLDVLKQTDSNRNKTINEAIILLINTRKNPYKHLDTLSLKYPLLWRKVNRRNAFFITNKIKQLKN